MLEAVLVEIMPNGGLRCHGTSPDLAALNALGERLSDKGFGTLLVLPVLDRIPARWIARGAIRTGTRPKSFRLDRGQKR